MSSPQGTHAPAALSLGETMSRYLMESPPASPRNSQDTMRRSFSSDTTAAPGSHGPDPKGRAAKPHQSRHVNAHSYCGRHTNQFLFGGRRVSDVFRAMVRKH